MKNHSAVEAIDCLAERYRKASERLHLHLHLHLRHLTPDCLELLTEAKDMVEIDVREDMLYYITRTKTGLAVYRLITA